MQNRVSKKVSLLLPDWIWLQIAETANRDGISMSRFISLHIERSQRTIGLGSIMPDAPAPPSPSVSSSDSDSTPWGK